MKDSFHRRRDGRVGKEQEKRVQFTKERTRIDERDGGHKRLRTAIKSHAKAELARVWLECRGDVRVRAVSVSPILPLEIRADVSAEVIKVGEPFTVQVALKNISDKEIKGLNALLAWPAGADIMAQGVFPKDTIAPGETTYAAWWRTPVYMRNYGKFVVVAECQDHARIVTKVHGPVSGGSR